jgi:secreted PhoX family phosphatase
MGLHKLLGCASKTPPHFGFGQLLPDPEEILDLPKGFSYQIISRSGKKMTDGFFLPELPDCMAAFPGPNGLTILVRNHEINFKALDRQGAFGKNNHLLDRLPKEMLYDPGANGYPCLGGTTTLIYDTKKTAARA